MIKILEEWQPKHITTCKICRCTFEYEAEDVTRITYWDDHGGHYPVCDSYQIKCPRCGDLITLYGNKIPKETSKMEHIDRG